MFRRFSTSNQPSQSSSPAPSVSRAATVSSRPPGSVGTNNPYRQQPPELSGLSLDDAPPPPDYNTALRHSISGAPPGHREQLPPPVHNTARPPPQQQQQQYQPPQQQTRPASQHSVPPPPPQARPSSVSSSAPTAGGGATVRRRASVEDPLAPLGKYDVVLLVDDSPSMSDGNLWEQTRDALMGVAEKCVKYDKDGIEIRFMNNDGNHLHNVTDVSTVRECFDVIEPFGSTPTGMALDEILRDYVDAYEDSKAAKGTRMKPMIVLVLTDGRADDPDGVKDCIIEMAGRLDDAKAPPFQLGVQFIQLGNDADAAAFLAELDDDLKGDSGVRDMVDTTPYEGQISPDFILKAALGSVVKRLDNDNS